MDSQGTRYSPLGHARQPREMSHSQSSQHSTAASLAALGMNSSKTSQDTSGSPTSDNCSSSKSVKSQGISECEQRDLWKSYVDLINAGKTSCFHKDASDDDFDRTQLNGRNNITLFNNDSLYMVHKEPFLEDRTEMRSPIMCVERISDLGSDVVSGGGLNSLIKQSAQLDRKVKDRGAHRHRRCCGTRSTSRSTQESCGDKFMQLSNKTLDLLPSDLPERGVTTAKASGTAFRERTMNEKSAHMLSLRYNDQNSAEDPSSHYHPLQYDPKPLVIYKASKNPPAVYKQNIIIRYFKPPKLPAPGPIIIREIRSPQQPPAPPLIIRQRMPTPVTPPPLILRERPPNPPKPIPPQVILKKLPSLPPAPRQVIIERYPPLPPKPRDIIIERWLSYEVNQKRKVIYQIAPEEPNNATPKNIIVAYQPKKPVLRRIVNRLGVVSMEPSEYMAKYGQSVLNTSILLDKIQKAGLTSKLKFKELSVEQQANEKESLWIDSEDVYGFSNVSINTNSKQRRCQCKCHQDARSSASSVISAAEIERMNKEIVANQVTASRYNNTSPIIAQSAEQCCYTVDRICDDKLPRERQMTTHQLVNSIMDSVVDKHCYAQHRGNILNARQTQLDPDESDAYDDYQLYKDEVGSIGLISNPYNHSDPNFESLRTDFDLELPEHNGPMQLYPNSSCSKLSENGLATEINIQDQCR